MFKELRRHYRLEDLPSSKRAEVEALLYAAILTLIVSRRLLTLVQRALGTMAKRVPAHRWAALLESVASDVLVIVLRPPRETASLLDRVGRTLLHEAVDPNSRRLPLLAAIEVRAHRYRAAES